MKITLDKCALMKYMKQYNDDVYSLAKRMDVAPSTIYRLLNGKRSVGSSLIPKLLKAFELDEKEFYRLFYFLSD